MPGEVVVKFNKETLLKQIRMYESSFYSSVESSPQQPLPAQNVKMSETITKKSVEILSQKPYTAEDKKFRKLLDDISNGKYN